MKRILKFIIPVILCFSAVFASTGCGKEDLSNVLYIRFFNGGAGSVWLENLAAGFKNETGITVKLESDTRMTENALTLLESGRNLPDLFFALYTNWQYWVQKDWLEPMDSVYDGTFDDFNIKSVYNGKTLSELLIPEFESYGYMGRTAAAKTKNYYVMPWTAPCTGIVYNADMLASVGYNNPPATEAELKDLITKLNAAGITPFSWGGYGAEMGYWDFPTLGWWAQYSGVEKWTSFYEFENPEVFLDEGRREALRLFRDLLIDENGDWKNSISNPVGRDHMDAQRNFVQGNAAMTPTGSWIENEIKEFIPAGFKMKMMPLPLINGATETNVLNTEAGDFAAIPKGAAHAEWAKAFLAYMNRPENVAAFTKTTGMPRPFSNYKPSEIPGITDFQRSCFTQFEEFNCMWRNSKSPFYTYVNVREWEPFGRQTVYGMMAKPRKDSPEDLYQSMYNSVCDKWPTWEMTVGL